MFDNTQGVLDNCLDVTKLAIMQRRGAFLYGYHMMVPILRYTCIMCAIWILSCGCYIAF